MIKQLSTQTVYQNNWMKVREDQVEFENGQTGIFGVVEKADFAMIVPFENGGFHLVKQYRYSVAGEFWEFPQGSYEDKPEVEALELAKGELKEETGLTAGKLEKIGFLYEAYGYCNQGFHIFLAQDLVQGQQHLQSTEQDLKTRFFTLTQFEEMIMSGEIKDAPTLSAFAVLKIKRII